jgi:hypothetical protein
MPTTYTPILQLALPATGELNGTWGTTVNDNITSMIEQAIAGLATINTWTTASHTLTTANGTTSEARCAVLECSGAPGAAATVICPTASKIYIIKNSVTGGFAVTLKTSAGTGISVPNGGTALLYCDGTNVVSGDFNGDVVGPASATDTAIATFDGTTGKLIKNNASVTIAANVITALGFSGPLNGTVGATTPAAGAFTTLTTSSNAVISDNSANAALRITQLGAGNALLVEDSANPDATPFVVAADGKVAIGSTTATENLNLVSDGRNFLQFNRASTDTNASVVSFRKARGTNAAPTIIASGDLIGDVQWSGYDGAAYIQSASIYAAIDGTPGTNDMPGRLQFFTTADGASTPTERMRINNAGNVGIGTSSPSAKLAVVGTGYSPAITLTDGATLNWDTSLGQVAQVTLGGNRTFAAPTNLVDGGFYSLLIIQDGTGSRTISWNAVFDFTGGTAPTLSTAAGSKDLITWRSDGTNLLEVGRSLGVA